MCGRRPLLLLLCASVITACRPVRPADAEGDGPAAAIVPFAAGLPLDDMLEMLQAELDAALAEDVDEDEINAHLTRAEAITDRLLDSRIPFEWLSNEEYSLNARLRQIQSMADRVQAQIRSRAARTNMLEDATALRADVIRLRAEIAEGGGAAPPPLIELLTRADSSRRPQPRPPPRDTSG